MKKFKLIYTIVFSMFLGITISACNDQLDINPDTVLLPEEAITNEAELQELLVSCYDALANQYDGNIQIYSDLLSDDLARPFNDGAGYRNEVWDRNTNIFNSDVGNLSYLLEQYLSENYLVYNHKVVPTNVIIQNGIKL